MKMKVVFVKAPLTLAHPSIGDRFHPALRGTIPKPGRMME